MVQITFDKVIGNSIDYFQMCPKKWTILTQKYNLPKVTLTQLRLPAFNTIYK